MRRPRKALAFALLVFLLLSGLSALAEDTAGYTAAELSIILTTYLSPSGENYGKPLPEWIKAYFNIEKADHPITARKPAASATVELMAPRPEATPISGKRAEETAVQTPVPASAVRETLRPIPTPLTGRIVMPAEGAATPAVVGARLAAYVLPIIAEASAEEPIFELSAFEPKPSGTPEPAPGVETIPAPASGPFTVHALNFLDTDISGTGLPGAEIVAYVSNEILTATVGETGEWKIVLPDWIFLMEGNEVRVTHVVPGEEPEEGAETEETADGGIQLIEEITLFVSRQQSMVPTVSDFDNTMTVISGTGVPNARVTVLWPDASLSVYDPVMLTGYWGIETGDKLLKPGDKISVIQEEMGLLPSEPRTVVVVERSPQPEVDPLKAGNRQITGIGVSGASISILSSAGFNGSVMLAGSATQWSYTIPEGIAVSAGDIVRFYQKVPGRTQSEWLEITVAAQ